MVKIITYDLDNKEEAKMVEDYYFVKYYTKTILFDWKQFLNTFDNMETIREKIQIIINHLNKDEFERYINIIENYDLNYIVSHPLTNDLDIYELVIQTILTWNESYDIIRHFKFLLLLKFDCEK